MEPRKTPRVQRKLCTHEKKSGFFKAHVKLSLINFELDSYLLSSSLNQSTFYLLNSDAWYYIYIFFFGVS